MIKRLLVAFATLTVLVGCGSSSSSEETMLKHIGALIIKNCVFNLIIPNGGQVVIKFTILIHSLILFKSIPLITFPKMVRNRLKKVLPKNDYVKLESHFNCYVVMRDGRLITVGHRTKRIKD